VRAGAVRAVGALAAALGLVVPVTSSGPVAGASATASPTSAPPALTTGQLAAGAAHACIVGPGSPVIDWSRLADPILSEPSGGAKDEALVWTGGRWHMVFSYVTSDPAGPGGITWNVATATSRDLRRWSTVVPWPAQPGVLGAASPDVVRDPTGGFVVTYQSDPGAAAPSDAQSRLYYRTSPDLEHWSSPHPLAPSLAPSAGDRMIDGALAVTGHQLLLGFKYSSPAQPDVFEVARSTTGKMTGPWQLVGRPDIDVDAGTVENYEFLTVAGVWHLVATSDNLDQPWLFTLAGDPSQARGWLRWTAGRQLMVPALPFDSGPGISSVNYEHANSAYLCDATSLPGHFVYLLYAGSTELTAFGGWGHARIAVARSKDLIHWQLPSG
jgi:hypothetical protein